MYNSAFNNYYTRLSVIIAPSFCGKVSSLTFDLQRSYIELLNVKGGARERGYNNNLTFLLYTSAIIKQ